MKNQINDMVGVDFPLFAFSHCRDVVVAASKSGAFGVLGASAFTPEQLEIELSWIDSRIGGRPYGVDLAVPENMAVKHEHLTHHGLLAQIPEQHFAFVEKLMESAGVAPGPRRGEGDDFKVGLMHDTAEQLMDVAFAHPIRLIVQALGLPPQSMIDRARVKGIPVGALVGAKEHAVRQVKMGVDVLIAQGSEAGAHCGEVATMVLIPEVVKAIEDVRPVPVLAAGGIVTGGQMVAAMAMGAAGAWTGSVWLPTIESEISPVLREKLLAARSRDTVRAKDLTGKLNRHLRSAWSEAWAGADSPGPLPMPFQSALSLPAIERLTKAAENGNEKARAFVNYQVGQAVGLLNTSKSCRTVVQEFMEEFAAATERVKNLVND